MTRTAGIRRVHISTISQLFSHDATPSARELSEFFVPEARTVPMLEFLRIFNPVLPFTCAEFLKLKPHHSTYQPFLKPFWIYLNNDKILRS